MQENEAVKRIVDEWWKDFWEDWEKCACPVPPLPPDGEGEEVL